MNEKILQNIEDFKLDPINKEDYKNYTEHLDSKETATGQGFHNLLRDEGLTGDEIIKPYDEEIDTINKKIKEIDKELGVNEAQLEYKERVVERKKALEKELNLLTEEKKRLLVNDTVQKPSLIKNLTTSFRNLFIDTDQRMVAGLMKQGNRIFDINQQIKEIERKLKILSYEDELRTAHIDSLEKLKFEKTKDLLIRKKDLGNLKTHLTSGDTAKLN